MCVRAHEREKDMRKRLVSFIVITAAAMLLLLGGCGQQVTATLEDIAADNPDIMKTIQEEITTPEGMSSEVSFSGDSFDITFKFDEPIDDADENALVAAFGKNAETLKTGFESAIADLETETGITGITGTVHIFNASGEETWTHEFPEKE